MMKLTHHLIAHAAALGCIGGQGSSQFLERYLTEVSQSVLNDVSIAGDHTSATTRDGEGASFVVLIEVPVADEHEREAIKQLTPAERRARLLADPHYGVLEY